MAKLLVCIAQNSLGSVYTDEESIIKGLRTPNWKWEIAWKTHKFSKKGQLYSTKLPKIIKKNYEISAASEIHLKRFD